MPKSRRIPRHWSIPSAARSIFTGRTTLGHASRVSISDLRMSGQSLSKNFDFAKKSEPTGKTTDGPSFRAGSQRLGGTDSSTCPEGSLTNLDRRRGDRQASRPAITESSRRQP